MKCKPEDIIYRQYCCNLDDRKQDIQKFLDALTPDTCYIIHRSQGYKGEAGLKVEPIYDSKFKVEKIE